MFLVLEEGKSSVIALRTLEFFANTDRGEIGRYIRAYLFIELDCLLVPVTLPLTLTLQLTIHPNPISLTSLYP